MIRGFFGALFGWLFRKLFPERAGPSAEERAGRAEAQTEIQNEVIEHVQKANDAVRVPDADRDERLRNRFDRARNKGDI